jgi:uncharacterized lipoprotein YmbA
MINTRYYRVFAAVLLLSSCAAPLAEHFYTLESATRSADSVAQKNKLNIIIGPLSLPEIVDRPQMVVHTNANQVTILEGQRWAESLRSAVPRVISDDLQQQLPDASVSVNGASTAVVATANYRIAIDIIRFDAYLGAEVELEARWRIVDRSGNVVSDRGDIREPTSGNGYDQLAAAHARALQRLSIRLGQQVVAAEKTAQGKR